MKNSKKTGIHSGWPATKPDFQIGQTRGGW
jgi:hypothetical protein